MFNRSKGDQDETGPGRPLLTVAQVAEILQLSPWTLYGWRSRGEGPPTTKVGRAVRYQPEALLAWLHDRTQEPTA